MPSNVVPRRVAVAALRIVISLIDTFVGNSIHWSLPTQVAHRLLTYIGNTPIDDDVIILPTYESTIDTLDSQRLVVIAIGNLFVLAAVHLFQFLSDFNSIHSFVFYLVIIFKISCDALSHVLLDVVVEEWVIVFMVTCRTEESGI